jgi:hypothetical protein
MITITITLDREQLQQAIEGLGHRIEHIRLNRVDYSREELEAAESALEVLTAAADPRAGRAPELG